MKILIPLLIITNLITAFFTFDLNRKSLETEKKLDEARSKETNLIRAYESRMGDLVLMQENLSKAKEELNAARSQGVEQSVVNKEQNKEDKKLPYFPSSTKELMFGSNPVVTEKDKAFWNAAKKGDLKAIRSLLREGINVDTYGDYGCTALFWAAKHNHKDIVQYLLENKAYIDAGAGIGGTPLQVAAYEGNSEVVELLVSKGASVKAKSTDGKTVFDSCSEEIAMLIRKGVAKRSK